MSAELCHHVVMYLAFMCSSFPVSLFGVIHNVAEPTASTACHLITDTATVECVNITESVAFIIIVSKSASAHLSAFGFYMLQEHCVFSTDLEHGD